MDILVFVSGIADPKLPVEVISDDWIAASKWIMSPFDESALELALRVRDADQQSRVTVLVADYGNSEPIMRKIAALRPDRIASFAIEQGERLNAHRMASALANAALALKNPFQLKLIGREFGDCDDGAVPPCIAEELGEEFFGLVQTLDVSEGGVALMRELEKTEEWLDVGSAVLASVTNDRRNHLRHPLMKNVMAAKSAKFERLGGAVSTKPTTLSVVLEKALEKSREVDCMVFEGSVDEKTEKLAEHIRSIIGA